MSNWPPCERTCNARIQISLEISCNQSTSKRCGNTSWSYKKKMIISIKYMLTNLSARVYYYSFRPQNQAKRQRNMIYSFNCLTSTVTQKILWISYRTTYESTSPCPVDKLQNILVEDPIPTETVNLGKRSHIIIRPALKNECASFMFPSYILSS